MDPNNSVIKTLWCIVKVSVLHRVLASVAQSDAQSTGNQEVTGSIPAWLASFLRGD